MTNTNETPQQTIDRLLPYRGPCAFCGGPDARHRIFDAIVDRFNAGEAIEEIADDLGLAEELVRVVVEDDRFYSGISEFLGE